MLNNCNRFVIFLSLILFGCDTTVLSQTEKFSWPKGKKMALSLSFDDGRTSNLENGIPLLNEYGVQATFFLVSSRVKKNLQGWKSAAKRGHEMANHTVNHPCSGNFEWSREHALEEMTLKDMKLEMVQANRKIEQLLGVKPVVFAYPCGQTFIGRGTDKKSYVPLVAELFLAGRDWLDEAPVDPAYVDMAQLTGMKMDNMEFEELLPLIQSAAEKGQWLILAGHDTGESGKQTTRLTLLRKLSKYAKDPDNNIWIVPIGTVAKYVKKMREKTLNPITE